MVDVKNEVDVVFFNIVKEYRRSGLAFSNDRIEYHFREIGEDKINRALAIYRDKDPSGITSTPEKYFEGILRRLVTIDTDVNLRETRLRAARDREIDEEIRREKKTVECEEAAKRFFNMAKQLAGKKDFTLLDAGKSSTKRTPRPVKRSWKPSPETLAYWREEYGYVLDPKTAAQNHIILDPVRK